MASLDRRNSLTLDEVSRYWREVRSIPSPSQNKICNSIITIDLAFEGSLSSLSKHLSRDKWARIRADFFDILISSFSGQFNLYDIGDGSPLYLGMDWPENAYIEFCPKRSNRKSDNLRAELAGLHPSIVLGLRWCWAEGRDEITKDDFDGFREAGTADESEEAQIAREFLDRLCEICVDEAEKSKRIAHRRWWRLSEEVTTCADKQTQKQIKKQMADLEYVWGMPSA